MAAPNLAWGGFRNGRIPRANLVDVVDGKVLQADAAAALSRLMAEFEAVHGVALYVDDDQDLYRDVARQQYMLDNPKRYPHAKAKAGTSVHGWARSADLSGYGTGSGTTRHLWLQKHAPDFGWSWKYGKELGEPWHFDYIGPITTTAGGAGGGGRVEPVPERNREMPTLHIHPNGAAMLAWDDHYEMLNAENAAYAVLQFPIVRYPKTDEGAAAWESVRAWCDHRRGWLLSTYATGDASIDIPALVQQVDAADDDEHAELLAAVKAIATGATDLEPLKTYLMANLPREVREELAAGLSSTGSE